MKVLFDYSIFFHQKYGGISRYFLNLHNELLKKNINANILAPLHNNIFLKNYKNNLSKNFYIKDYPKYTRKIINGYNNIFSNFFLKLSNTNILHKTFYQKNISENPKVKKIITVYDLAHEIFYKDYKPLL